MSNKQKIIIDEAIPDDQIENIHKLLGRKGIKYSNLLFIAKEHQGMPDYQIVTFLLNQSTVFFTADRPLHNTVLERGYKSFFFNGDNFSPKPIKGISTIKFPFHLKKDLQPKNQYHEPKTEIRHLLLPKSEKSIKKLRTKRRRIRSYFGGTDNMEMAAITVSFISFKSSMLVGIRIKISSNTGKKALDASECYIRENVDPVYNETVAFNHALILMIQLMLNYVKTNIYYDTHTFKKPIEKGKQMLGQYQLLFGKLLESFSHIEFTPSAKGFFIERLRRKLDDLSISNSNEVVQGNIAEIDNEVRRYYSANHYI